MNRGNTSLDNYPEAKKVFDKAFENLVGVEYEPIAYLGNQVVAGYNHLYLCKMTYVLPYELSSLAFVTIYEDLEGNVEITNISDFNFEIWTEDLEKPEA